jgi:hypothetical protein
VLELIRGFLDSMDRELQTLAEEQERFDLYHVGRSALVFHHGLALPHGGTRDFDAVQIAHPLERLGQLALERFGKETANAQRLGLYLEMVPSGLPPLPASFRKRCTEVDGGWKVIRLWRLEAHDLAVSKLKSFRAQDREDIQFLCDKGSLNPRKLRELLEAAFLWSLDKDGDPERDRAFANLARVVSYLEGRSRSL